MNLIWGIIYGAIAQVLVFLQIQGSLKYEILINNKFIVLLSGIPISWLFIESVRQVYIWSDGQLWPGRLIGFSIGIVVFTAMSILLFGEGVSLKTLICLILSCAILAIQIFWK
ncbi:hypothetical protein EBQ93_04025 [bacterium]|nr:hypothetical protein [bacterium]